MDRLMIVGLIVALSCASASQVYAQLGPLGPPPTDVPGMQQPWNGPPAGLPPFAPQNMPGAAPGFAGPNPYGGPNPYDPGATGPNPYGAGPGAAFGPEYPPAVMGGAEAYVSPHPTPKAPQNLGLYRPSIPGGVEAKKLSPLPSVSVREYPYLRRGRTTDRFITPPGMEMPEGVGPTTNSLTWMDRLRNLLDPLGMLH